MASNQQVSTVTNTTKKVTLGQVFKEKGLEVLSYIDKKVLTENDVVFCISKIEEVPVTTSKFNISEQWVLTILVPASDGSVRKFWLTFIPNETRNDFMQAIEEGLVEAHKQNMQCVHSCKLRAIPIAQYQNDFYAIDFTQEDCNCELDA